MTDREKRPSADDGKDETEYVGPDADALRTRSSLISGLQSRMDWAWERFFLLYHPVLIGWARKYGFGNADADDFVGQLIKDLAGYLDRNAFDRKKGFRAYMRVMLKHILATNAAREARAGEIFSFDEQRDDRVDASTSILDAICEAESKALQIIAKHEVLASVDEVHQLVWMAMNDEHFTIAKLVEEFGMSESTLRRIRRRVNMQMKRRYEELTGDGD